MDPTLQRLRTTAQGFWRAHDSIQKDATLFACFETSEDLLRLRCDLGFIAVDASLALLWREQLIFDWAELQSLLAQALNDETRLHQLQSLGGKNFRASQWKASLRFLCDVSDPTQFEPSLIDYAVMLSVWAHSTWELERAQILGGTLLRLHAQRAVAATPARELSELAGYETLRSLTAFRGISRDLHPALAEIVDASNSVVGSNANGHGDPDESGSPMAA